MPTFPSKRRGPCPAVAGRRPERYTMAFGIGNIPLADLEEILDNIRVGIVVDDAHGNVIYANKYYETITGIDLQQFIGKTVWDIFQCRDIRYIDTNESIFDLAVKAGKPVHTVLKYKTSDRVITTTAPLYAPDGSLKYVLCTVTNYSEARATEQALALAYAKIDSLETRLLELQQPQVSLDNGIIVKDKEMQKLYSMAFKLSRSMIPVMLLGETGVGKDVLAKYIHNVSERKDKPFIHVNMGAIPPMLFESELFGYEAGAFTGASKQGHEGLIRMANGGALFLDEVGELPLNVQAKLLQVIQSNTVRSVGGLKETPINVKIISATNRNLEEMVERGEFRLDLYYRLNVAELRVPPLRERTEEIPLLIQHFLQEYNAAYNTSKILSPDSLNLLLQYQWPGNVRELRHTIESLVVISPGAVIEPQYMPPEISSAGLPSHAIPHLGDLEQSSLKATLDRVERRLIREAISSHATLAAAASSLGLDASTLAKKRKKYGL